MSQKSSVRIGISGWTYPRWRRSFYPAGLAQRRELEFASRSFPTVEVNGSFYSLQAPSTWRKWAAETPNDFTFAVKGGRFITHMKKLKDIKKPLANFFASGLLALGPKLGPVLWQLPPFLRYDRGRMERFFELLPKDFAAAEKLARRHDDKVKQTIVKSSFRGPIRHAIEVRHPTYLVPEFMEQLRKHGIAFVIADSAGKFPYREEVTTDFVYVRLHGGTELYTSGYTPKELDEWANKIGKWRRSGKEARDVYVYFDNDAKVHAPFDARALAERVERGSAKKGKGPCVQPLPLAHDEPSRIRVSRPRAGREAAARQGGRATS